MQRFTLQEMERCVFVCVDTRATVADPAGGLKGLQPLFQNRLNVCLSTPISLLLNAASGLRNSVRYS